MASNKTLKISTRIHFADGDFAGKDFRILSIGVENCVLFPLADKPAPDPFYFSLNVIKSKMAEGQIIILEEDANHENRRLASDEERTETYTYFKNRNNEIIDLVLYKNGKANPDVYDKEKLGKIISHVALVFNLSKKTILRLVRKYWRGGMTPDAAASDYENCGGPGNPHNNKEGAKKKIGRLNGAEIEAQKKDPNFMRDEAIFTQEEQRMIMFLDLEKYYKDGTPLTKVHEKILAKYYTTGNIITDEHGSSGPELVPANQRLTYDQLYFYFKKEWRKDPAKFFKNKLGERKFNLTYHPKLGYATLQVDTPGEQYSMDSTIFDLYGVSSSDRAKIISRRTCYAFFDSFSCMVGGFCHSSESSSFDTMLLGFDNCLENKVELCKKYGISILESQWPAEGAPASFQADNAEMKTRQSDKFIKNLGIRVDNNPCYTPIWKPLIESFLKIANIELQNQPGGVDGPHKRGEKNRMLGASLTPEEITKILLLFFIYYNNYHVLKNYPRTAEMIADKVPPIPVFLWAWGVAHRGCLLHEVDRNIAMLNLLPNGTASNTEKGWLFQEMIYLSDDQELNERYAVLALTDKRRKFDVVFRPKTPSIIYIQLDENKYTPLRLGPGFERYQNLTLDEIKEMKRLEKLQAHELKAKETQARVIKDAEVAAISQTASIEAQAARKDIPKAQQLKALDQNTLEQQRYDREMHPLIPDPDQNQVINLDESPQLPKNTRPPGYVPQPSFLPIIEKIHTPEEKV